MKSFTTNLCLWVILIQLIPRVSAADDPSVPPKIPNMDNLTSTLTSPPVKKIVLGKLVVGFEITTLSEIEKSAGVGKMQHRGDAGGSEDWLCYTVPHQGQSERIWISSGELGGAEHVVGSFYAEISDKSKSDYCPELPSQLRPASLGNKLWIGSSQHQLEYLFGEPSMRSDGWWIYSYSGKASANGFDQLAILGVRILNGKVVDLFASQATTD